MRTFCVGFVLGVVLMTPMTLGLVLLALRFARRQAEAILDDWARMTTWIADTPTAATHAGRIAIWHRHLEARTRRERPPWTS